MRPELYAALTLGSWVLVVLLTTTGIWFMRQRGILHQAVAISLALVGCYLLFRLQELVLMLLIAGVLAFIVDGPVTRLAKRIPRTAAIAVIYLGIVATIGAVIALLMPRVVHQAFAFVHDFPTYAAPFQGISDRVITWYNASPEQVRTVVENAIHRLQENAQGYGGQLEHVLREILAWSVKSILILITSIYLLLDRDRLRAGFIQLFPLDTRADVEIAVKEAAETFRAYLRGQGTVILFVAVSATVGMLLAGVKYAFFLGAMAGILEVIPYFGAAAGAIPAVTLAFMKSPGHGIFMLVWFIGINQLEGHLVIPLVMGKNLEMRPIVILLALIGGELMFGVVGMVIAVPVVSLIRVLIPPVVKHYRLFRMRERSRLLTQAESAAATSAAATAAAAAAASATAAAAAEPGAPPIVAAHDV